MALRKNNEVEKLKLFVASMLNDEQDAYSKLIASLRASIGKTNEFDNIQKILNQVYDAKIELLEKIYKEMQGV